MADASDSTDGLTTAVEIRPTQDQLRRAEELLTGAEAMEFTVTEIIGVPGVRYDITCAPRRVPGQEPPLSIGGWRHAPLSRLLETFQSADPVFVERVLGNAIPDIEVAAGQLESWTLANDMRFKWIMYCLTMGSALPDVASLIDGHKSVLIIDNPDAFRNRTPGQNSALLLQHAMHMDRVNSVNGVPLDRHSPMGAKTAPDMGTDSHMMDEIARYTHAVVCRTVENGGCGNPSPNTAIGTAFSIQGELDAFGESGDSQVFLLEGVGAVGSVLLEELARNYPYATIYITDIDERLPLLEEIRDGRPNIRVVRSSEAFAGRYISFYIPAGPPSRLTPETLPVLRNAGVRHVVGPANAQYREGDEDIAQAFHEAGIHVVPAYLANCGGIATAFREALTHFGIPYGTEEELRASLEPVRGMTERLMRQAQVENINPEELARQIVVAEFARRLIAAGAL